MSRLTKTKIGELLNEYSVGNFSSLIPGKVEDINDKKIKKDSDVEFKKELKTNEKINTLFGKELELVYYLVNLCEKEFSLRTKPVFSKDLINHLALRPDHIRNIISRLNKKNIFSIVLINGGKHAARIFEFEKETYSFIAERKNKSSSIGYNIEGETNNKNSTQSDLEDKSYEEVSKIDFSSMEEYGFNYSHLIQIYREFDEKPELRLSFEIIQDSIDSMAFDLKHNNVNNDFKNSPAVVLVSLLKKGKPYSSKTPEKFVSPQIEAMRRYLEIKSIREIQEKELDEKIKKFEMQEWIDSLSDSELMGFYVASEVQLDNLSDKVQATLKKRNALEHAKQYFEMEIWPAKRKALLSVTSDPLSDLKP